MVTLSPTQAEITSKCVHLFKSFGVIVLYSDHGCGKDVIAREVLNQSCVNHCYIEIVDLAKNNPSEFSIEETLSSLFSIKEDWIYLRRYDCFLDVFADIHSKHHNFIHSAILRWIETMVAPVSYTHLTLPTTPYV